MLSDQTSLTVLLIDDDTFEGIGDLTFSTLIWPVSFIGYATFQAWVPPTENNLNLLKQGNVVWCGGDNACFIEIISEEVDEESGAVTINIKGRSLETLLTDRVLQGTYSALNKKKGEMLNELVIQNCVSPTEQERVIPYVYADPSNINIGNLIATIQRTGGEIYTVIEEMANDENLGFSINIDLIQEKLIFKVYSGVDRTESQSVVDPVILSTDLNDLLSSKYYLNKQQEKNVAYVMGEGSGATRKKTLTGETSLSGFRRKELFVDARDVQSSTVDSEGNTVTLTDEQNIQALKQRGTEKLSENNVVESFEVALRIADDTQYKFGEDYHVGDKVTIIDKNLGVKVNATISSAQESLSDVYALDLVIGYELLTINQKLKKLDNK